MIVTVRGAIDAESVGKIADSRLADAFFGTRERLAGVPL